MTPAFGGQYSIQLSYGRFVGAIVYSLSRRQEIRHLGKSCRKKSAPVIGGASTAWRPGTLSAQIEPIERHHLDPCGDKVIYELLLAIN